MATNVAIVFTGRDLNTRSLVRGLQRDFEDLRASSSRVNQALGLIGASLSASALVAYGRSLTGVLASLDDLSEMTGETVENLSMLHAEARISGTEFQEVAQFANRLAKGLSDADDETKNVGRALAALGVDARNANGELKNTPQLMREIAHALQRFQDGPGKQAILQALGSKGGAGLIPFFNDLARTSELTARATAEQAAAAEATERAFRRLKLEADTTAAALLFNALPAIEGFARGLGDVVASGRKLEGENPIEQWAKQGALAAATLIDALGALPRMAMAVSGSFAVVYRDIQVLDRAAQVFFKPLSAEARAAFEVALEERNSTLAEANRRYLDLLNYNGRATEEAVRRNIEAVRRGRLAMADLASNADPRDLRLMRKQALEFDAGGDRNAKKINDGKQLIELLQRESQELRNVSAEERVLEDLRDGRYRLTQIEKERVGALLEQNVALRQQRSEAEMLAKRDLERLRAQQDAELASEAEFERVKAQVLEFTGQTDAARKRRQREVVDFLLETGQITREEANRARRLIDGVADAAEQFGLVFASSIGQFIEGGGRDLRAFFDALGKDLLKLTTQLLIVEPLARALRDAFKGLGSGASIGDVLGGLGKALGLPSFDVGTPYVPRDMLAVVHRGERIVPAAQNRAGGTPISVQQTFVLAGPATRETQQQIAARAARGILDAHRRLN